MEKYFAQFLREPQFLNGLSPATIKYYSWVIMRWNKLINEFPAKLNIKEFVIKLQESPTLSSCTINSYIRGMNALFTWLHENDFATEHFRMKKIKKSQNTLKVFTDRQLRRLLSFTARTFAERRTYAMICFAVDY